MTNDISPAYIVSAQDVSFRGMIALGVDLQTLGLGHPSGFDLHGHDFPLLFKKKFHFRRSALPAVESLITCGPQFLSYKILCHITLITAEIIVQERGRGNAAHRTQKSHIKEIEFEAIFLHIPEKGNADGVYNGNPNEQISAFEPVQRRR